MKRPKGKPCAELRDDHAKLEILTFKTHGQFAVYWRENNTRHVDNWKAGPRHYASTIGAMRAVYVIERRQF